MKKTGFIAIVGRPNVGKSTLLNAFIGEKVAIVSSKPQTTRNRIVGIHTVGENQYVFLDTPGMHKPRTRLGDYMVKATESAIGDVDAAILVTEARESVGDIEAELIKSFKQNRLPAILVINKTDLAPHVHASLEVMREDSLAMRGEGKPFIFTNCFTGEGIDELVEFICRMALFDSEK